jgi:hypothetical protein
LVDSVEKSLEPGNSAVDSGKADSVASIPSEAGAKADAAAVASTKAATAPPNKSDEEKAEKKPDGKTAEKTDEDLISEFEKMLNS